MVDMTRYNEATESLVHQVQSQWLSLPSEFNPKYDMSCMVHDFRSAFCDMRLRRRVLQRKYEQSRIAHGAYSAGFCGIASYTWNHLFRMPDGEEIWRLKLILRNKLHHAWLENKFTGEPLDLTFDQFVGDDGEYLKIPYDKVGDYNSSDFEFKRAYTFARRLGIDLGYVVFVNSLRALGRSSR